MATNQTVFNRFNFFPKTFWKKFKTTHAVKESMVILFKSQQKNYGNPPVYITESGCASPEN
jgi:hypothetical protein